MRSVWLTIWWGLFASSSAFAGAEKPFMSVPSPYAVRELAAADGKSLAALPTVAGRDDLAVAVECRGRGGLPNAFEKLRKGAQVRVAYLGGSITAQDGWRPKTLDWLRQQFPAAEVSEINAAIGGTGSDLGVFRLKHDVLDHNPDLLFVEFAVNDGGASPGQIYRSMEGIVRQTWKKNPATDICFVYTLAGNMLPTLQEGRFPRSASAMERVADYYGIPSIHMGLEVARLEQAGKLIFKGEKPKTEAQRAALGDKILFSPDAVHPYTDTGHQLYFEAVVRSFAQMRQVGQPGRHVLAAPFVADNWERAQMIPLSRARLSAGWRKLDPGTNGLAQSFGSRLPGLWEARKPGECVSFRFRGTTARIYDLLGPDCGQVTVAVDDRPPAVKPRFDAYCTYHRLASLSVGEEMTDEVHTVKITVNPDQPDKARILSERGEKMDDPKRFDGTAWYAGAILLIGELTPATTAQPDYLSDHTELILSSTQDWGVLGFDAAAHAPDKEGSPIQIGETPFAKGLGHHANGVITLLTDGKYESFDAEVGLQPCAGGSVIFHIIVDGMPRYDSGVMRSGDAPKSVHVPLAGAQEIRLEARDAGDGISCDMANWAEARLTPAPNAAKPGPVETAVDMAQFARFVTWDPNRLDGARASRIEEFRADDLFTETELTPEHDGSYAVPVGTNGVGCIGLQWLDRRSLRDLSLEFNDPKQIPATNTVSIEGWFGESAWQGNWTPLAGEFRREGKRLVFQLAPKAGLVQTRKVRWVLPVPAKQPWVHLTALTRSQWATTNLWVQIEKPMAGTRGLVTIWNGEVIAESKARSSKSEISWNGAQPLRLVVRYSRPSSLNSDPTVLQFRFPTGSAGVAVGDVLANDCVYLPDHGLFVAREPLPVTLADYQRRIAGRKTIMDEVRALPDQTLAQAMAKTHHEAQREGPVLLSLAGDNTKFIVESDGAVRVVVTTNAAVASHETRLEMKPSFAGDKPGRLSRTLDGGWLPIPLITAAHDGVAYRERSFVAPCDEPGPDARRFNRRCACVVEFTITNTQSVPVEAVMSLSFADRRSGKALVKLTPNARGWLASSEQETLALAATTAGDPLIATAQDGALKFAGTLPSHGRSQFALFLPGQSDIPLNTLDTAQLRAAVETYWNAALSPAMQIETPDPLLNNVIRSSQVRCLMDARNEAGGERVAAWIAAMSYGPLESESHSVIRGMDFMGHTDFARRSLDFFICRYNTNGFLTTGYTTFGTAWHLWALGEHWQLTRDTNWLRQVAPEIARVGHWIVRQTEKTKRLDPRGQPRPEFGLMPPGVLADWNAFAYHFAMNAYYTAALRELGAALGDIGHPDAALFRRFAAELKADTLRAYAWTQARAPALALRNGTWIPHYPSQVHSPGKLGDFFPGQDAGRSWCYDVEIGALQLVPTGVLEPHSREVGRMLDHMEDIQFLADGWFDYPAAMNRADWFNLGGFSKVQPYYTRNCEVYALRDDVKPFVRSYFNTLAAMLNPEVLTLWEHFNHSGAWDKTHETGYFLHQTRTMFVQERGNELWLGPFITDQWLKDGGHISVKNAPTRFGPVAFEIHSHVAQGFIEARIEPTTRRTPRQVILRLRHPQGKPMRAVIVNGKRHRGFDAQREIVAIEPGASPITLRVKF